MSWVKNAVETRFFFSGRVNKGQESLLQRLQPICFYIDPWKAILGFSCSEHDGRSFSWCLFWNPFFVPLLLCDSCHVHWLKLNFLTCNVSRMHSHVTLEWKFLYSQRVCLNVCIQIKEWKFYPLNYSSASVVKNSLGNVALPPKIVLRKKWGVYIIAAKFMHYYFE